MVSARAPCESRSEPHEGKLASCWSPCLAYASTLKMDAVCSSERFFFSNYTALQASDRGERLKFKFPFMYAEFEDRPANLLSELRLPSLTQGNRDFALKSSTNFSSPFLSICRLSQFKVKKPSYGAHQQVRDLETEFILFCSLSQEEDSTVKKATTKFLFSIRNANFYREDEGSMFRRNVGNHLPNYKASHSRRPHKNLKPSPV